MKRKVLYIFILIVFSYHLHAQTLPYSQRLAQTAMHLWPDSVANVGKNLKWSYDQGVVLKGIEQVWLATGDPQWFHYIQRSMDRFLQEDGTILDYKAEDYNIDNINNGKLLLMLYRVTGKEKYKNAVINLRNQLRLHPRTQGGGFWHKKVYPNQMWLDGLYMAQPFYAEYAQVFGEDSIFNDVTRQFVLMEQHARDAKTGLLYHGYDESKEQQWADKVTGHSPNVWGRALGWYGMAMVDALNYFPEDHPGREKIIAILNRFANAIVKVQDAKTGMWYDIVDLPNKKPNYTESSATAMLAYTLAKAVRKGYLPNKFSYNAQKAFNGLIAHKLTKNEKGYTNLEGTVSVSGLGGKPYRDGSFDYYMREKVVQNDPKGIGAFILAATEIEMLPVTPIGKGRHVVIDNYFNNEWRQGPAGREHWHYTWDDRSNGGYHFLGNIFQQYGAHISSLTAAPTASNLKKASVYIIVDPDTEKETAHPNYMNVVAAKSIASWVKSGGVLVMLANNQGNCDMQHFNILANLFGIRFNDDNQFMVKNDNYSEGEIPIPASNLIFKTTKNIFLKEISSLQLSAPAIPALQQQDMNIMALARYGKGTVFALGDPWIYNEYIDGRKLPLRYENYKAAHEWVQFLLQKAIAK